MKKSILALIFSAGLAHAATITDTFTATIDRESTQLHALVNGQFSYTPNGAVIGMDDLTAWSMTMTDTFGSNGPGATYNLLMDSLLSFSFDPTTDLLTEAVTIIPRDPTTGIFSMGPSTPQEDAFYGITGPEIAFFGGGQGPASDPPVVASAPEPWSIGLAGLGLIGLWGVRRRAKR